MVQWFHLCLLFNRIHVIHILIYQSVCPLYKYIYSRLKHTKMQLFKARSGIYLWILSVVCQKSWNTIFFKTKVRNLSLGLLFVEFQKSRNTFFFKTKVRNLSLGLLFVEFQKSRTTFFFKKDVRNLYLCILSVICQKCGTLPFSKARSESYLYVYCL